MLRKCLAKDLGTANTLAGIFHATWDSRYALTTIR